MKLNFRVNDTMHEISVDPRLTLLERDLLRVVLDRGLVYRWIDADVFRKSTEHVTTTR